jgi:hypothetical protein
LRNGLGVANSLRANASGVCEDVAKLMEEKETPPEETSGTLERVVWDVEQVMRDWMAATVSETSLGRAVLPMTKHALLWRSEMRGTGDGVRMWMRDKTGCAYRRWQQWCQGQGLSRASF